MRARGGSSVGDQGGYGSVGIKYTGYQTSANLYVSGNIYATGTITPSDTRIKDNQEDYDTSKALESILAIKLKTYVYNKYDDQDRKGQKALGYIAQELETIEELNKYNVVHTAQEPKNISYKIGEKEIIMPNNSEGEEIPNEMQDAVKTELWDD